MFRKRDLPFYTHIRVGLFCKRDLCFVELFHKRDLVWQGSAAKETKDTKDLPFYTHMHKSFYTHMQKSFYTHMQKSFYTHMQK